MKIGHSKTLILIYSFQILLEIKKIKKTKNEKEKIKIIKKVMNDIKLNKEFTDNSLIINTEEKKNLLESLKEQEKNEDKWIIKDIHPDDFFSDLSERLENKFENEIFKEFLLKTKLTKKKPGLSFKKVADIFKINKSPKINIEEEENLDINKMKEEDYLDEKTAKFKNSRTMSLNSIFKRGSILLKKPIDTPRFEDKNENDKKKFFNDLNDNNSSGELNDHSIENIICDECNEKRSILYCLSCKTNQCEGNYLLFKIKRL
jgi:hypothetical protein